MQRPVHDADAGQIPRSDHQVVYRSRLGERRQVLGIVREVRVHLEDERRAGRERVPQPVDVGAAEAARARAVQHFDASRMLRGKRVGHLRRCRPATHRRRPAGGSPDARGCPARAPAGCPARCTSGRRRGRPCEPLTGNASAHPRSRRTRRRTQSAPDQSRVFEIAPAERTRCRRDTDDAASKSSATGRLGLRHSAIALPRRTAAAAGTRGPMPRGTATSVAHRTGRSARLCRRPYARAVPPTTPDRRAMCRKASR